MVKSPPAKAGDAGDADLISMSGRSQGVRSGNSLQYSCLENYLVGYSSGESQRVGQD